MIEDSNHPWTHFLHARKLLIDFFMESPDRVGERQGEDRFTAIARTLSMDPTQVQLIHMTAVDPQRIGDRKTKL